ncbi:MAG: ClbS/DfsB family four-helix bundle protein [Stappiaceae bacterium]
MAAKTKPELLEITQKEYDKLSKLIASIDDDRALIKTDGISLKDVVAHRAHWIDLFLGWYHDGQAGKPVYFPAEGYKWNDLKRYNSDLRNRQVKLDWVSATAMLEKNYRTLVSFIEQASEATLYGGPMKGANNNWTPGRWAEAAGPSHFRSAAKCIRAQLKAAA